MNAQKILTRHFPNAELYDDVRKVGINTHEKGSIDIVCGGFPCQDVSIAGKRAGLAGERSGLWFEFARIIDELEPRWVIAENVPGLLSSNKGRDFAVIIQWLAQRGYGVVWRVLDAQYFGVPQRRRRVFIVGSLGNGRSAEVLFESEGGTGDTPPSREAGKEVAYSLRANPSHSGDKGDGGINTTLVPSRLVAESLTGQNYTGLGGGVTARSIPNLVSQSTDGSLQTRDSKGIGSTIDDKIILAFNGRGDGLDSQENITPTMRSLPNKDGHQAGSTGLTIAWEMSHADEAVRESGEVVPTLQARMGTGGNQVPMVGVRRLTPTECERLQGFPDGWTDGQADTQRYKQLGNAVAVPVVEWLGKRINR